MECTAVQCTAVRQASTASQAQCTLQPKPAPHSMQGRLVFPGFPDFRPNLTPKQVIRAGSFGG